MHVIKITYLLHYINIYLQLTIFKFRYIIGRGSVLLFIFRI